MHALVNVHWITIDRNAIVVDIHSRLDRPLIPWILSRSSLFLAFKVLEIFFTVNVSSEELFLFLTSAKTKVNHVV